MRGSPLLPRFPRNGSLELRSAGSEVWKEMRGLAQNDHEHQAGTGSQFLCWGGAGGLLELWDRFSRANIRHHNPRLDITA